jgi:hypothetical protein
VCLNHWRIEKNQSAKPDVRQLRLVIAKPTKAWSAFRREKNFEESRAANVAGRVPGGGLVVFCKFFTYHVLTLHQDARACD